MCMPGIADANDRHRSSATTSNTIPPVAATFALGALIETNLAQDAEDTEMLVKLGDSLHERLGGTSEHVHRLIARTQRFVDLAGSVAERSVLRSAASADDGSRVTDRLGPRSDLEVAAHQDRPGAQAPDLGRDGGLFGPAVVEPVVQSAGRATTDHGRYFRWIAEVGTDPRLSAGLEDVIETTHTLCEVLAPRDVEPDGDAGHGVRLARGIG